MRFEVLALAVVLLVGGVAVASERYGLGKPPTAEELKAWDIDVRADGVGLPEGHGSVVDGLGIYGTKCAACHGDKGQGGSGPALVGGKGSLATKKPVQTVGSYWPYATTLFDYIHRAMPFNAPQSLSADETYAVTAYVLRLNDIVGDDAVLDKTSLPKVAMPNRNGFTSDPRPDTGKTH